MDVLEHQRRIGVFASGDGVDALVEQRAVIGRFGDVRQLVLQPA
jgi:hypothetical protein